MSKIRNGNWSMPGSPAVEMRDWIGHAVNARRDLGASEAVYQVARELRIKPRRVTAILRGEIARVWADEWQVARDWYRRQCEQQARKLRDEAAALERMVADMGDEA